MLHQSSRRTLQNKAALPVLDSPLTIGAMALARYQLQQHPTLTGPHTKDELYLLVERGSLGRGEIVVDRVSGRSHKVGELIEGMRPPRNQEALHRLERPAYQEFSGDTPWDPSLQDDDDHQLDVEDESIDPEIDDFLLDDTTGVSDEEICYHGHPSWLSFGKSMLLCLLLLGAAVLVIPYGMKYCMLGIACASFTFCCLIIARQHRDYFVSGERVEMEWGIIGRSSREVRIVDIRSIDVHTRGVLGFLGIGTIDFSSSSSEGVEVQFAHVRKPHKIKELVRQLQRRAGLDV